jgi:ABC-type glycerol-3-phosphate transport system permease component
MTADEIAKAKALLTQLKPNVLRLANQATDTIAALKSGEAWIATGNLGTETRVKDQGGPELSVFTPKEGTIGWMDAEMIVKGGANQNLIMPFLEVAEQAEYMAANFIPVAAVQRGGLQDLINQGQQERASVLRPGGTVSTMSSGPGTSTQAASTRSTRSSAPDPRPATNERMHETDSRSGSAGGAARDLARLELAVLFLRACSCSRSCSWSRWPSCSVFSLWRTNTNFGCVTGLNNYARFFNQSTYIRTFAKTLVMAAAVTGAGLALAVPFTYFLVRYTSRRLQRAVLLAVIVPFWTSYLLRVYAWQAILGERGALNQFLMGIGLIKEPIHLSDFKGKTVVLAFFFKARTRG